MQCIDGKVLRRIEAEWLLQQQTDDGLAGCGVSAQHPKTNDASVYRRLYCKVGMITLCDKKEADI